MRDVENNSRFHGYGGQKRKAKENVLPLLNEKQENVTAGMVLKFSAPVFTGSQASQTSHGPEPLGRGYGAKCLLFVNKESVQDKQMRLTVYKSIQRHSFQGPEGTS